MENNPNIQSSFDHGKEDNDEFLNLTLSTGSKPISMSPSPRQPQSTPILYLNPTSPPLPPQTSYNNNMPPFSSIPQAPPPPPYHTYYETHIPHQHQPQPQTQNAVVSQEIFQSHARPSRRARKNPFQSPRQGKPETLPPPYPWATTHRAMVHSLDYLVSHNMTTISGEVQCKKCDKVYKIEYDLQQKFNEIASFISNNKSAMHDRAPSDWMNPALPSCESCGSSLKPVVSKKRSINWLFLLLGKMLGCCKLSELKYFCKHTKNHRTGAKDRVLYLTYLGLCKQLDPMGPFDV